jgi:hypothetical protein
MKLSIAELMVILDTLEGSLCFANEPGRVFRYDHSDVKRISLKIQQFLNSINIEVNTENEKLVKEV